MSRPWFDRLAPLLVPQLFLWSFVFQWITRSIPEAQLVSQIVIGVTIGSLILGLIKKGEHFLLPEIALPAGLLLILQAVTIPFAPLPALSLDNWLSGVLLFIILIVFVNHFREQTRFQVWENTLLSIGVFLAIFNLALVILRFTQWSQLTSTYGPGIPFRYRLPGLFLNHPNVEAAFTNLLVPILLGRFLLARGKAHKLVVTIPIIILVINLYFSSSRGAWVAAFISIASLGLLYLFASLNKRGVRFRGLPAKFRNGLIIFGLPISIAVLIIAAALLLKLFQSTGRPSLWPSRVRPWSVGWSLFSSAPIFGHGVGSAKVLIATDPTIPTEPYLVHTHNIILQIGTELGLVGIAISAWILYEVIKRFSTSYLRADFDSQIRIASTGAGLIGLLVHHLVDYFLQAPVFTVAALLLLSSGETYAGGENRGWTLKKTANRAFPVMATIFILASFYPMMRFNFAGAVNSFKAHPSTETALKLCQVAQDHPSNSYYEFTCGIALGAIATTNTQDELLADAISNYQSGLAKDPYWPIHWANLAALEWDAGLDNPALEHIRTALDSAPSFPVFNFNYARMLELSGQAELAAEYYRRTIAGEPCLINSDFFDHDRVDLSDFSGSDIFSTGSEVNDRVKLGWYQFCSGQVQTAREEFTAVVRSNPTHPSAHSGLALISLESHDYRAAKEHSAIALYANPGLFISQYSAGKVAFEEGNDKAGAAHFEYALDILKNQNYSQNYYNVVYRGPYLKHDTVPQLETIFISEQIVNDFLEYADELDPVDPEKASNITALLDLWIPDNRN